MAEEKDSAAVVAPVVAPAEAKASSSPWGQASFKMHNGKAIGDFPLAANMITFGRNKGCDIKIPHPHASGYHCALQRDAQGVVFLEDTSTNGTWVNGKLVGKGKKVYTTHGDIVHVVRPSKADNEEIAFTLLFFESPQKKPAIVIGKYEIGDQLGSGTFANVHVCLDSTTGLKYAVKVLDKKKISVGSNKKGPSAKRGLVEEVKILQELNHPNIVKVFASFETEDALYIVLELLQGGDLLDRMISLGEEFPEDRARLIFIQMMKAVSYLHSKGVAHRDLKPENILLETKDSDKIKLTDFGLSRIVGEGSFMKTICGTPMYVAPEVVQNMGQSNPKGYGKAVDVWSMGVILYMLLCGEPPFDQRKPTPILDQVKKGVYKMPEDLQQSLSKEAQDLIVQLLAIDPLKRITLEDVAKHPWVVGDRKSRPKIQRQGAINVQQLASLRISALAGSSSASSRDSDEPPSPSRPPP